MYRLLPIKTESAQHHNSFVQCTDYDKPAGLYTWSTKTQAAASYIQPMTAFDMCSAQIMGTESVAYTHKNKGSCFLF